MRVRRKYEGIQTVLYTSSDNIGSLLRQFRKETKSRYRSLSGEHVRSIDVASACTAVVPGNMHDPSPH